MIAQHYICIANIDVDEDCDCECCDGYDNQIIYIYINENSSANNTNHKNTHWNL